MFAGWIMQNTNCPSPSCNGTPLMQSPSLPPSYPLTHTETESIPHTPATVITTTITTEWVCLSCDTKYEVDGEGQLVFPNLSSPSIGSLDIIGGGDDSGGLVIDSDHDEDEKSFDEKDIPPLPTTTGLKNKSKESSNANIKDFHFLNILNSVSSIIIHLLKI